jgi:hypothetical protein
MPKMSLQLPEKKSMSEYSGVNPIGSGRSNLTPPYMKQRGTMLSTLKPRLSSPENVFNKTANYNSNPFVTDEDDGSPVDLALDTNELVGLEKDLSDTTGRKLLFCRVNSQLYAFITGLAINTPTRESSRF